MNKTASWLIALVICSAALSHAQTGTNLRVSPAVLSFTAAADGEAPPPQTISLVSIDGRDVEFAVVRDGGSSFVSAPGWISISAQRATTPAVIQVAADASGLAAGEAPPARIVVTDPRGIQLSEPIPVSLRVIAAPQRLVVEPEVLRFSGQLGGFDTLVQRLAVRNAGSGPLTAVSASVAGATPWLRVATDSCARECLLQVTAAIRGLEAGGYQGTIRIESGAGTKDVAVELFVAERGPLLKVSPEGVRFEARAGQGQLESRQVTIVNAGQGTLDWEAAVARGGEWLRLGVRAGAADAAKPGAADLMVSAAGLAAGAYHGLVRITSPAALNSPLLVPVILRVAGSEEAAAATFSEAGLLFKNASGSPAPSSRVVRMFASTAAEVPFQSSALAGQTIGTSWVSVARGKGTVSTSEPAPLVIAVTPSGLAPGAYTGTVNVAVQSGTVRMVNVTLVVSPPVTEICTPDRLAAVHVGLPDNFTTAAGMATPLAVKLTDNCGNAVTDALALASFSTGEPALTLEHIGDSVYAATWVPSEATSALAGGTMAVTARAWSGRLAQASATLVGSVGASLGLPRVARAGVVHNFDRKRGGPLGPGTIVEIYGADLATARQDAVLTGRRLPTSLGGASVTIGGVEAPLYFASGGQVNAQVPVELRPLRRYQVLVNAGGAYGLPETINVNALQPGVAAFPDGRVIAQDAEGRLIGGDNPAQRGGFIVVYLVGMGATSPPVASGVLPPDQPPLAEVVAQPQATLGGRPAQILFAGMTPCCVGLYQINLAVPTDAPTGDVKLSISQGGVTANETVLRVE